MPGQNKKINMLRTLPIKPYILKIDFQPSKQFVRTCFFSLHVAKYFHDFFKGMLTLSLPNPLVVVCGIEGVEGLNSATINISVHEGGGRLMMCIYPKSINRKSNFKNCSKKKG